MVDICQKSLNLGKTSVNTGQICMEFEADTEEKLQKIGLSYETVRQRSGLKVIDEQTHIFL